MTCALRPSIQVILNIFEPIIFPRASCVFFLNAAATDAASSGNDVPHAIRVRDMKASPTPKDFAISTALSTKKSQLMISIANPAATLITDIQSGEVLYVESDSIERLEEVKAFVKENV
jgi:hypothetical protein